MDYKNKLVLILGGNSDVGKSLAVELAVRGANLLLSSRVDNQLNSFCSDLNIRYSIICENIFFDAKKFSSHKKFYTNISKKPDILITCIGYLDNQNDSEKNFEELNNTIISNYSGLVSIVNIISRDFKRRGYGNTIGISSVAGERGRSTNYIYGSTKSAYSVYLSGLRAKLFKHGSRLLLVKPGFINSKNG